MPTKSGKPLIFINRASLEAWMGGQSREVVVAVATRAALQVAPLAVRVARNGLDPTRQRELALLTGRIFRALAIASVSAEDPIKPLVRLLARQQAPLATRPCLLLSRSK